MIYSNQIKCIIAAILFYIISNHSNNYAVPKNQPLAFTSHALKRIQERNITKQAVLNAIRKGYQITDTHPKKSAHTIILSYKSTSVVYDLKKKIVITAIAKALHTPNNQNSMKNNYANNAYHFKKKIFWKHSHNTTQRIIYVQR